MPLPSKSNRRFFPALRHRPPAGPARGEASSVEVSALWSYHRDAVASVHASGAAANRIVAQVARQRSAVDALADRARAVSIRAKDLTGSFGRIVDAFARLELVALNAGLEGARMGEGSSQAMGLVAEEVRAQTARGSEASRDLAGTLAEIGSELLIVNSSLDRTRDESADIALEAGRASELATESARALVEIGESLRKATGSDPETAEALVDASDHARALLSALSRLRDKTPRAVVLGALGSVREPLSRMLQTEDENPS